MDEYLVRSKKLVTVSDKYRTIIDGAFVVKDGIITDIGNYSSLIYKYKDIKVLDYSQYTVTPTLVDCHTHVLEYAPSSIFPVTEATHLIGGTALLLRALSSGITALGEQICGHPNAKFLKEDYVELVEGLPIDINFSLSTISLGFENIVHFSGVTGTSPISRDMLMDNTILKKLLEDSDYPGENIFINATPANFQKDLVPRAGEVIYTQEELDYIVSMFHENNKKIGCHVAREDAIDMAINAGFDVIHHGHGMNKIQMKKAASKGLPVVVTPLGGTHLTPNSPDEIVDLMENGIVVAISTDAYLPPSKDAPWLNSLGDGLKGSESLMAIAYETMEKLELSWWNENDILKLITLNPAIVLNKDHRYGSIAIGKEANFLIAKGIPGLDITNPEDIKAVFYKGNKVISR